MNFLTVLFLSRLHSRERALQRWRVRSQGRTHSGRPRHADERAAEPLLLRARGVRRVLPRGPGPGPRGAARVDAGGVRLGRGALAGAVARFVQRKKDRDSEARK